MPVSYYTYKKPRGTSSWPLAMPRGPEEGKDATGWVQGTGTWPPATKDPNLNIFQLINCTNQVDFHLKTSCHILLATVEMESASQKFLLPSNGVYFTELVAETIVSESKSRSLHFRFGIFKLMFPFVTQFSRGRFKGTWLTTIFIAGFKCRSNFHFKLTSTFF